MRPLPLLVMWSGPWSLRHVWLRTSRGRGSASCWSKVTHRSSAGQRLLVLFHHHHHHSVEGLYFFLSRLCCHTPFIITGCHCWRAVIKYTLEITLQKHEKIPGDPWREGSGSPFSLVAKFLIEHEASLQGPVPGSSVPHPNLAFPSLAGQHFFFSFVFGLNSWRCHRDIHPLVTLQRTVQCGLTFIHF